MDKLYLDTNIYITAILGELGPKGVSDIECHKLFSCFRDKRFILVCSDFLLEQLKYKAKEKGYTQEQIDGFFSGYSLIEGENMITVKKIGRDFDFANTLKNSKKNIDFEDAVHYSIAKRAGAKHLVTYNISDYQQIADNPSYARFPSDFINC